MLHLEALRPEVYTRAMLCFAAIVVILYLLTKHLKATSRRLPPSPAGDPVIGHLRHVPLDHSWLTFWKWKKTLGNIFYLNVFGRLVFVVNSPSIARELLDAKGANTSDRPYSPTLNGLMGLGSTTPFMAHSDRWRRQRRVLQQYFNPQAIKTYRPLQQNQVHMFLQDLLSSPDEFVKSLRRLVAMISLKVAYGENTMDYDEKLLDKFISAAHAIADVGDSGGTIIDLIPALQYVPIWFPTWFPGVEIKRYAIHIREMTTAVMNAPVDELKARRAAGKVVETSFAASMLDDYAKLQTKDEEIEEDVKGVAMVTFTAAYDTTSSTLLSFILNMVLHPEVAKRAQFEIDSVTNGERLPTLDDRPDLPYIDGIVKETYRFHPSGPLGAPHATTKEETFGDWTIPSGSIILGNIWAMMKDEENFRDPLAFIPERHLETLHDLKKVGSAAESGCGAYTDPNDLVFGFGRRICPGRFFADATVWLTVAAVLATFDIRAYVDPKSNEEIPPEVAFISGFSSSPKPFKCTIAPRSAKHASLVVSA